MFVRWQRKKRVDRDKWGQLLCAVLVESRRVDGEPRQRTIAYLGSIREGCIESALGWHVEFWHDVARRLDQLGDGLAPDEREKVEAALAKRVRRLTESEFAKVNKMLAG